MIEESLGVGSWGGAVDKLGGDTASPGGVVDKSANGSVSPGGFEEREGTRELVDDMTSPPPLSTPF